MPHLSPMSWILTMLSMWLIILSLMASSFQMNHSLFSTSQMIKSLKQKYTWMWS
uniref:ATP synthase F0 subunit 8 n=1 Tax=Limnodrilus hoffmeisteri TaxID=76587 RepID=A0A8F2JFE3_9ANNE|nr:ATP synthase F0 subunit 8 [Limnodrilus hoffmeisteri]